MGAVPDADAMRDYLQKHLGVPSSQIMNLRNSKATRAAIIDGIRAFSLNEEIEEGDPILIYFAGHGGSADTPKDWEVGSAGKIELLVPMTTPHWKVAALSMESQTVPWGLYFRNLQSRRVIT